MLPFSLLFLCFLSKYECARILAVFPTPSFSHQVVFKSIIEELAIRGHEIVVITPDPDFLNEKKLINVIEIDVHNVSYKMKQEKFLNINNILMTEKNDDILRNQMLFIYIFICNLFEAQMKIDKIQDILNKKTKPFDLILAEDFVPPALGFSHIFKVPTVQISSFLPTVRNLQYVGAPDHQLLYPTPRFIKLDDLNIVEKKRVITSYFNFYNDIKKHEIMFDEFTKKIFGPDTPPIRELYNNKDMLFTSGFPIWDSNRPMPTNVQYTGGIHMKPAKKLPQDLQSFLNSSKHGVIYLSFGNNIQPSKLPAQKIQILLNVLSHLPYDVIWKWDKDELPGRSNNIRISKWLPQADLLRHPKVKLFMTQGGLQSTDEAIVAGVPLLGIPVMTDQWYNGAMYMRHKIGLMIDLKDLNEDNLKSAIDALTKDDTYQQNIRKFRSLIHDQPHTPLERAVWWTEYVLRHGGARHLRSPAANMPWTEYYEIQLLIYSTAFILCVLILIILLVYVLLKFVSCSFSKDKLKGKKLGYENIFSLFTLKITDRRRQTAVN